MVRLAHVPRVTGFSALIKSNVTVPSSFSVTRSTPWRISKAVSTEREKFLWFFLIHRRVPFTPHGIPEDRHDRWIFFSWLSTYVLYRGPFPPVPSVHRLPSTPYSTGLRAFILPTPNLVSRYAQPRVKRSRAG